MPKNCVVKNCHYLPKHKLFQAPKDPAQLSLWKQILKLNDTENDNFYVCEIHFSSEMIKTEKFLESEAYPSVCLSSSSEEDASFSLNPTCQCCKKTFVKKNYQILTSCQKMFKELIGYELSKGLICWSCYDTLQSFHVFRKHIRELHEFQRGSSESFNFDPSLIKEEPIYPEDFIITEIKTEPEEFGNAVQSILPFTNEEYFQESIDEPATPECFGTLSKSNGGLRCKSIPPPPQPKNSSSPNLVGFKCQYCDNRFIEPHFLFEHIKIRHTFPCDKCKMKFPYKISLIKHQMATHGPERELQYREVIKKVPFYKISCPECGMKFAELRHLNVHMKKNNHKEALAVKQTTRSTAGITRKQRLPIAKKACVDCGLELKPEELLRHRLEVHKSRHNCPSFECDLCGFKISGRTTFTAHMMINHLPRESHKCEDCGLLFDRLLLLVRHKNRVHAGGSFCHFCHERFDSKDKMIAHRRTHYRKRPRAIKS